MLQNANISCNSCVLMNNVILGDIDGATRSCEVPYTVATVIYHINLTVFSLQSINGTLTLV